MTGLRALRQERGLTLEALAFLADVDIASISRIERGLARPRKDTVVRLAKALGIAVTRMVDILADTPEPVPVRRRRTIDLSSTGPAAIAS